MNTKRTLICRTVPKVASICERELDEGLATYDAIVDDYIRRYRDAAEQERQFFKDCSFQKAIRYAALCKRPDGKRHNHHLRRTRTALAEADGNRRVKGTHPQH